MGRVLDRLYPGDRLRKLEPWLEAVRRPAAVPPGGGRPGGSDAAALDATFGYSAAGRAKAQRVDPSRLRLMPPSKGVGPADVLDLVRPETRLFFEQAAAALKAIPEAKLRQATATEFCSLIGRKELAMLAAMLLAGGQYRLAEMGEALAEAGFFALRKSEWEDRLIADARAGNLAGLLAALAYGILAPAMTLPDIGVLTRVRVCAAALARAGGLSIRLQDIEGCFHFTRWISGLAGLYATERIARADINAELARLGVTTRIGPEQGESVQLVPVSTPMGAQWACLLVQDATTEIMRRALASASPGGALFNTDDGTRRYHISEDGGAAFSYIDDLGNIDLGAARADAVAEAVAEEAHAAAYRLKQSKYEKAGPDAPEQTAIWIGVELDTLGIARAPPRAIAALAAELLAVRRAGAASGAELARLAGKFAWFARLRRPLLAALGPIYPFTKAAGGPRALRRRRLWRAVAADLQTMALLLPLAALDMTMPEAETLLETDATLSAFGAVEAPLEAPMADAILDLKGNESAAEAARGVPWRIIMAGRFRGHAGSLAEPLGTTIAIKELLTAVMVLERARAQPAGPRRLLYLTDNQVALGILRRGRTSAPELAVLARQAAAAQLAAGIFLESRWINSDDCAADAPSRGRDLKGQWLRRPLRGAVPQGSSAARPATRPSATQPRPAADGEAPLPHPGRPLRAAREAP